MAGDQVFAGVKLENRFLSLRAMPRGKPGSSDEKLSTSEGRSGVTEPSPT